MTPAEVHPNPSSQESILRFILRTKKAAVACAMALGSLVTAGLAAPAQAVEKQTDTHCVIVVGKSVVGQLSPVRSKTCGDGWNSPSVRAATARADVLLMEWFEHSYNNPSSFTRIIADDGPCDGSGYRLDATGFWANRISGFNSYNDCDSVTGYDFRGSTGSQQTWLGRPGVGGLAVPFVGSFMNDRIESFWIHRF